MDNSGGRGRGLIRMESKAKRLRLWSFWAHCRSVSSVFLAIVGTAQRSGTNNTISQYPSAEHLFVSPTYRWMSINICLYCYSKLVLRDGMSANITLYWTLLRSPSYLLYLCSNRIEAFVFRQQWRCCCAIIKSNWTKTLLISSAALLVLCWWPCSHVVFAY